MRSWLLPLGLSLCLLVPSFGGVAAAAGGGVSGQVTSSSHGQSGSHKPSQTGQGAAFGQSVAQAVYEALSSGESGTALANAVHMVIGTFKPNAKGISVAEAVYQSVYGVSNGSETISLNFTDMGGAGWAAPSVFALFKGGVVKGTTTTTFSPNENVTGAQLLTMLSRMQNWTTTGSASGSTTGAQYLARAPAFALQAIREAVANGVLQGVGGLSNPNAPLTRAQAVTLLINSLGLGQLAQSQNGTPLTLSGSVPSWASGAMSLAIQLGLVDGSNGQILANQTLTRGQMAVLLARLAMLEALATQSP